MELANHHSMCVKSFIKARFIIDEVLVYCELRANNSLFVIILTPQT